MTTIDPMTELERAKFERDYANDVAGSFAAEVERLTNARNRLIADIIDMREKIEAYESTAHHSLRPGLNFALGLIDDLLKRQAQP